MSPDPISGGPPAHKDDSSAATVQGNSFDISGYARVRATMRAFNRNHTGGLWPAEFGLAR